MSDRSPSSDDEVKRLEDLQTKLDSEHRNALAAVANLQEEVFLLRDEVSTLAKYIGILLISDNDGVRVVPTSKTEKIRSKTNE